MATKTCESCPSYLNATAAVGTFGRSVGTAMCARYATPMSIPVIAASESMTPERLAEKCDKYGEFKPDKPINFSGLMIGLPDPEHMIELDQSNAAFQACTACTMCKHYVDEQEVSNELGFTAGLCKAKGRLVLTNRTREEARGCTYRAVGQVARTTDGVMLSPVYTDGFSLPTGKNPTEAFALPESAVFEDPNTYPTDREVTPAQSEIGIRAWRRIHDPEDDSRFTYLPIFRNDFFSDEERAKIPQTGDDEHPELYKDHGALLYTIAVLWTELDETPTLWGEPGTGKTELGRHMAWIMQLPFERISISGSTELDDLAGKMLYKEGVGTIFHDGRLPKAWVKPCVVVVDEPNTGPDEVWHFLRPLTDNSRQLIIDASDDNSSRDRNDNCYLALAMNPAWDHRNRGVAEIADADASRLMHIYIQLPDEDIEREIITERVALDGWQIDRGRLDLVMKIAVEIRALAKDGTIPISWGLRPQIQVARALRWFSPVTAYRRVIADFMEPTAGDKVLDVVRANSGPPATRRAGSRPTPILNTDPW